MERRSVEQRRNDEEQHQRRSDGERDGIESTDETTQRAAATGTLHRWFNRLQPCDLRQSRDGCKDDQLVVAVQRPLLGWAAVHFHHAPAQVLAGHARPRARAAEVRCRPGGERQESIARLGKSKGRDDVRIEHGGRIRSRRDVRDRHDAGIRQNAFELTCHATVELPQDEPNARMSFACQKADGDIEIVGLGDAHDDGTGGKREMLPRGEDLGVRVAIVGTQPRRLLRDAARRLPQQLDLVACRAKLAQHVERQLVTAHQDHVQFAGHWGEFTLAGRFRLLAREAAGAPEA